MNNSIRTQMKGVQYQTAFKLLEKLYDRPETADVEI